MAVTTREQQMLDLREQGLSNGEIAERLKLKPETVVSKLNALSDSPAGDVAREAAIRAGTKRLGAAVIAAGGHR
jgi:DNA-binding NarL/FixJ family response regulator